jgi:hypothetical protein
MLSSIQIVVDVMVGEEGDTLNMTPGFSESVRRGTTGATSSGVGGGASLICGKYCLANPMVSENRGIDDLFAAIGNGSKLPGLELRRRCFR